MNIYIFTCIYIYKYTYTYTYAYIHIYTCINTSRLHVPQDQDIWGLMALI